MYSEEIRQMLSEKNIETGDRIKLNEKEGRLMPKPETGDPEIINLKLDSGYNIGLEPENIELVEKHEASDQNDVEIEYDEDRPDILVLHTGGTIASRVSYEEGGVKPAFDPEELVEMYPELAFKVNIHSKVVAQMLSEDMEPGHWMEIAETIDELKDSYDGIIVGHGTDTMQYTGAALSLMLKGIDTGVLLVGAQRSSDRPSSDASMNMYCASKFLAETDFTGFGICMHSSTSDTQCSILPPQKVRKMHTSRRDAFRPINEDKIAEVDYETGDIEFEAGVETENQEYEKRIDVNPNIAVIKSRPGMKPEELEFILENDFDGLVVEGTGLGHLPVNSFDDRTQHHEEILQKLGLIAEEMPVVMASQCLNGRVNMNVYDAGVKIQDSGVVSARDMHPELAYVKLAWSIGNTESRDDALELFQKDINGEISERSMIR
ncbi:MAG: Glu-tRNA(Gln) amidotransferase subunit GatD [Candidatus Nanohaloarchaea archaeon]